MPLELEAILGLSVLERGLEIGGGNPHRVGIEVRKPNPIDGLLTNPTLTLTLSLRERG